jgi:uncharacterized protein (DUF2267 family)
MLEVPYSVKPNDSLGWNELVAEVLPRSEYLSVRDADLIVGRIIHPFRNSLTFQESGELIALLPDYFKFIYVSNWRMNDIETPIQHLDELILRIRKFDESKDQRLFSNELEILKAVIVIFSILDKYVRWETQDFLDPRLKLELKRAME